jgi:hypothetical protein
MISRIKASAFRSEEGNSKPLTPEESQKYLAQYVSSTVRLWVYHPSLSRLVLRIERPAHQNLRPIDLAFASVSDIRCPVHWVFGVIDIYDGPESSETLFRVPSAGVSVSACTLLIVIQDEYPNKLWELGSTRIA